MILIATTILIIVIIICGILFKWSVDTVTMMLFFTSVFGYILLGFVMPITKHSEDLHIKNMVMSKDMGIMIIDFYETENNVEFRDFKTISETTDSTIFIREWTENSYGIECHVDYKIKDLTPYENTY